MITTTTSRTAVAERIDSGTVGVNRYPSDPPLELRHSFVSLLSASDVRIEDISRLVGHSGTAVTETVYRHQLHAVLDEGARAMDHIFPEHAGHSTGDSHPAGHSPPPDAGADR